MLLSDHLLFAIKYICCKECSFVLASADTYTDRLTLFFGSLFICESPLTLASEINPRRVGGIHEKIPLHSGFKSF